MANIKLYVNSTISTPGAQCLGADIKYFNYDTPMERFEYAKTKLEILQEDIVTKYNLKNIDNNGWVYIEIRKGIPGLNQVVIITYECLQKHSATHGYVTDPNTPALWRHITRYFPSMLTVGDFGIKYVVKQHETHLLKYLKEKYDISIDWKGASYCGLTIARNYAEKYVDISMIEYIKKALQRFKHVGVKCFEDATALYNKPYFGAKKQWTDNASTKEILAPYDIKHVQSVVGTLLYYDTAMENTMLVALGDLELLQKITSSTLEEL